MSIRLALIGAVAGALLVAGGWFAWDRHGDNRYQEGWNAVQAEMAAQVAHESLASASRLAALETAHNEMRRLENEKEAALAAAVDAGRVRLRVNATCPSVPQTADAGVGDGARPELDPVARPTYHALRSGLIKVRADLDLCRAAVRELTGSE